MVFGGGAGVRVAYFHPCEGPTVICYLCSDVVNICEVNMFKPCKSNRPLK